VIRSLEDAWRWYEAVSDLVGMMDRVARRYFLPELGKQTLEETLHRDDKLHDSATIRDLAKRVTEDLDDLAVLLLFSVFEATVRERTLEEMDRELEKPPRHLVLKKAVGDAKDTIEHGSFGRLTESYKALDPDLRTMVDQVRHYRNWVAHGRRGSVKNNVDPKAAITRLEQFLKLLDADSAGAAAFLLVDPIAQPAESPHPGPIVDD
jgi:hypothetical protein